MRTYHIRSSSAPKLGEDSLFNNMIHGQGYSQANCFNPIQRMSALWLRRQITVMAGSAQREVKQAGCPITVPLESGDDTRPLLLMTPYNTNIYSSSGYRPCIFRLRTLEASNVPAACKRCLERRGVSGESIRGCALTMVLTAALHRCII